jgi:hypothetical protein
MSCFSDQHFVVDSPDDVRINVRTEHKYVTQEFVTIKHGYSTVTISGAPGIAESLLKKLMEATVVANNTQREADHAERAMLKDEEVRA